MPRGREGKKLEEARRLLAEVLPGSSVSVLESERAVEVDGSLRVESVTIKVASIVGPMSRPGWRLSALLLDGYSLPCFSTLCEKIRLPDIAAEVSYALAKRTAREKYTLPIDVN